MSEFENMDIQINLKGDATDAISSANSALMSIEQVSEEVKSFKADLASIRDLLSSPKENLFDKDILSQVELAERTISKLVGMRKSVDEALGSDRKESNTSFFNYALNNTRSQIKELQETTQLMSELRRDVEMFSKANNAPANNRLYNELKIGVRQFAESQSKAMGTRDLASYITGFMHTQEFQDIKSRNANANSLNSTQMKTLLTAAATTAVGSIHRSEFVGWDDGRRSINKVQDLLPKAFANIKLGRNIVPTRDASSEDFSKTLTNKELDTLGKIILKNQYVAKEAEAAGLIRKQSGTIQMNNWATRGNVNDFAGKIAHLFSLGAVGLPMYEIDDIYDPKHFNSIASKTNKTITVARNVADALGTQFEWLDPGYYKDVGAKATSNNWYDLGKVKAAGRKDRMQFLEVTPQEVLANGSISFTNGKPTYTPVIQSEYQNFLSQQKGATPFTHNGMNDNEIFVKLPNEAFLNAAANNDNATQDALQKEVARVIGTTIMHNNRAYTFSGLTKTHAAFTAADIKEEILKTDPYFFNNGETRTTFNAENSGSSSPYELFAKTAAYNRLQRVEGENVAELYGVDPSKLKVVVGNLRGLAAKGEQRIDGQNIINSQLFPEGFQGRSFSGKSTYSPYNIQELFKLYSEYVDADGNLVLPGANINGGDLIIPPDVDIIEDYQNIKTNKPEYDELISKGLLSSESLSKIRQADFAKYGVWAKTTYDAANTNPRFMSAQLANTLAFTPEAQRYFQGVYFEELASLNDPTLVIEKLFRGDDLLSQDVSRNPDLLYTREAQRRIQSYRESINSHMAKGDLLLPEGEAMYSMISAWVPDVINDILVAGGKTLTSDQKKASLKYQTDGKTKEQLEQELRDQILYFGNESASLALARNPATINGNVETANKATDEYFQTLSTALGIDKNALYVDPSSEILKRLQGADEDGDTALVYAIKNSKDKTFASMMKAVLINTANRYKRIRDRANMSQEDMNRIEQSNTESIDPGKESYSIDNPEDLAFFWAADQKSVLKMGSASGVTRNAFLRPISQTTSRAMLMAERDYDINTVSGKKAKVFKLTDDEMSVLGEGAPVGAIVNWAMKSRVLDEESNMVDFDKKYFRENYADKVAKSNFASINSPNDMRHAVGLWYAKNVKGEDVSGGFKWDEIFENLSMNSPFKQGSDADNLVWRLNDLRKDYLQGKFLVFSNETMDELDQRAGDASREIIQEVNNDSSILDRDKLSEIRRRQKLAGIDTIRHLYEYGFTERNLEIGAKKYAEIERAVMEDDSIADDLKEAEITRRVDEAGGHVGYFDAIRGISSYLGEQGMHSTAQEYHSTFSVKKQEENEKLLQKAQERKAKLEEEKANKIKEYEDAVTEKEKGEIEQLEKEIDELKKKDEEDKENSNFDAELIDKISKKEERLDALKNPHKEELDKYDADIAKANEEIKKAEQYQKDAYAFYRDQGEYQRIVGGAEDFISNLRKSERSKEAYLNSLDPASKYLAKQQGIADYYTSQLDQLSLNANLDGRQQAEIQKLIRNMGIHVNEDFRDKGESTAKYLAEDLSDRARTTSFDYDKSQDELDGYLKKLKEAETYQKKFIELAEEAKKAGNDAEESSFREAANRAKVYTDAGYASLDKITSNIYEREARNNQRAVDQIYKRSSYRKHRYNISALDRELSANENEYEWYGAQKDALSEQLTKWQNRAINLKNSGQINTQAYTTVQNEVKRLTDALAECEKQMRLLSGSSGTADAVLSAMGQTAARVVSQFGRQMFSRAMNEAKQFTMYYDAAMTEIQMVTLKTDEEIGALGDSLIDKAVELKAPVKDITDTATALYRQGLTDPQVDSRLEDVIKFSKTAKVSATDAIKLVTVATSNGQDITTDRVFDVVSALGDSAATEALQITKGLQKSLSAANEVGVSFEELVAMLTVVTSKTQLSGSVAGTTMRNIMSRMTRFGDQDSRYAPQVQLLKNAGIEIFDNGDMRSVTNILSEIGALWEGFDDKTKQDIAYALGSTEQFSNVMALMQGFSETDETGQNLMQKYLNLADASDGITDEKYIHQIESLDGAMSNLQTTFDRLINSTDVSGGFVSILNFVADSIDGFTSLNEITEGFISTIITLGVALTSIAGLAKTNPWLLAIMGIAAGAMAIGKIAHDVIEGNKPQTIAEQRSDMNQSYNAVYDQIDSAKTINEKRAAGKSITDEERNELKRTLTALTASGQISFDGLTDSAGNAITSINQLANSAEATAKALNGAEQTITQQQKRENEKLSFSAANEVDDTKGAYQGARSEYEKNSLNYFEETYVDPVSEKEYVPKESAKVAFTAKSKGELTDAYSVDALYTFVHRLAEMGAFDTSTLSSGKTFASLYKNGELERSTLNKELDKQFKLHRDGELKDGSLLHALVNYLFNDDMLAPFVVDFEGFGDYNADKIYESIIGRDDVATSGLADLLHEILINEANLGYEFVPNFDYSDFLDKKVFGDPDGYRGFIKTRAPERYAELTQSETNNILPEDSPIVVFSKAIASARATQGDAAYKDAWIAAADMMRLTTGTSGERFASFAEMITNNETGLKDWDELIRSKGSEELVNAWASIVETDKDGNYKIKDGLTNEEAEAFERLLYGQVDRTKFMSQYRSADMIAASAQNTFNRMTADGIDPYALWQNLYNIDEANALAQNELIQVIGEDLVNKLIGGTATIDDKKYAQNLINAYSASSRIDSGYYQKEIQNIIDGLTGSYLDQMNQYNKLYEEQTQYERALHSYDMMTMGRATDEDYSLIGSAIGMDSSRVKELSRTKEGREKLDKLLEDRIEVYSDILSEALLAMLPEDAKDLLTSDMDIDGILEIFKGKVSDDVYAIIETVFRSLNITYDGEEFDIPIDSNSGSPTPWQSLTDVENKYYADNRDDEMFKALGLSVFQHGNAIPNSNRTFDAKQILENYKDEDWNSFFTKYPLLASAFESYVNNEGIIDKNLMSSLIQDERYGGDRTAGHYDFAASVLFGEGYADGNVDWLNTIPKYAAMQNTLFGSSLIDSVESSEEFVAVLELMNSYLEGGSVKLEDLDEALNKYNEATDRDKISNSLRYNKAQKQTVETFEAIQAGGEDAADAYNNLYKQTQKLANANWALSAYKSGDRSSTVTSTLASQFNIDETDLKKATAEQAAMYYETMGKALEDQSSQLETNLSTNVSNALEGYMAQLPEGTNIDLGQFVIGGNVDVSGLTAAFASSGVIVDSAFAALLSAIASLGATFSVDAEGNGIQVNLDKVSKKSYGGSGGGNKKTASEKLLERIGHGKDLYEHQIKMVQYEQTAYQNADELGNYGKMIEEEIAIEKAYLPVLQSNITAMKNQLASVKVGSDEWYKLRDAILEAEESYKDINNTIKENEKKLEENKQAILALHTDLEDIVVGEIEARIEKDRDMLSGSVSMQDIILNAIKQRYQDEWDLIKKDIDKKKEALQEEKDLIDQRLDARKEAEDEAAKYEELAELKKQLAMISMDSTRTKDAAALRESIAELEKEIGWDIAEKEAENEKNAIQDQIDAYDDYITKGDEELETLLEDSNNFSEEVNNVLKLNQTELFDWMKQNVKEYSNSLDDMQKQMVQGWEDTYKQMKGITDTFWDQVNSTLSSKDTFLEYMTQSDEFINASEDERGQMFYEWSEAYDKWIAAQKTDAEYDHTDSGLGNTSGSEYTGSTSSGSSSSSSSSQEKYYAKDSSGNKYGPYTTIAKAMTKANELAKSTGNTAYVVDKNGKIKGTIKPPQTRPTSTSSGSITTRTTYPVADPSPSTYATYVAYATGGIADYTGLAWLDGTPSKPERILSPEQTKSFDSLVGIMDDLRSSGISMETISNMAKWSTLVNVPSIFSHVGSDAYQGNSANIGDIFVNITEAQITDDRDIEELANVVGQKFVKEIGKQGFNLSNYNW